MRNIKSLFFLLLSGVLFNISPLFAQVEYTEIYPNRKVFMDYESFNVAKYRNRGARLNITETREDGTLVEIKSYGRNTNIEVFERPPYPAMHIVYKEFYPNGKLKQKVVYLPSQLEVGKHIECDATGNCTITDLEEGRNKFGYNDVLKYLEEQNMYNLNDGNKWDYTFWYTEGTQKWGVRVNKNGVQHKMIEFDSKGKGNVFEFEAAPAAPVVPIVGTFEQEEE